MQITVFVLSDADSLSVTQCIHTSMYQPSVWRRLSCPRNGLIHVHQAFLAVTTDANSQFCHEPISVADAHCVISDVTADVIAACATFTNCRMSESSFEERFSRNNCTGQSDWSQIGQHVYLHVDYDCLPSMLSLKCLLLLNHLELSCRH